MVAGLQKKKDLNKDIFVKKQNLHERRPNRARCNDYDQLAQVQGLKTHEKHTVYSNALLSDNLITQRSSKSDDSAFCCRIVNQLWMPDTRINRGVKGDRAS